jgi:hypothetical protein
VQLFAAKLLPALRERGHEIVVVTAQCGADPSTEARYKGLAIHRFPFRDVNAYTNIGRLMEIRQQVAQLKRAFEPELVHMNYAADLGNFFHLTTAGSHPAPLLVTLHGMSTQQNSLVEHALGAADWVVGCSKIVLAQGRQFVRVHQSATVYIFKLTTQRYSISNTSRPDSIFTCQLGNEMSSRLAFNGRVGSKNDFIDLTGAETLF